MKYSSIQLVAALVAAIPVAAQQDALRCTAPGAVYGIVSFDCVKCGMMSDKEQRMSFTFFGEPVVTGVDRSSALASGDVIEAVNGQPITTRAGADQFVSPPPGANSITIRRGRDRQTVQVTVPPGADCPPRRRGVEPSPGQSFLESIGFTGAPNQLVYVDGVLVSGGDVSSDNAAAAKAVAGITKSDIQNVEIIKGPSAAAIYGPAAGTGVVVITTKRGRAGGEAAAGRFGFAVSCNSPCSVTRATTGLEGYKYIGYPPIIAIRAGSPAERSGLRVGDFITKVNGRSILDDKDALQRAEQADEMRITVERGGFTTEYILRIR